MKYSEFVGQKSKLGSAILNSLSAQKCHILHMAIGAMGEAVELQKACKFNDWDNVQEEIGDYDFFLTGLENEIGEVEIPDTRIEEVDLVFNLVGVSELLLDAVKKYVIYNDDKHWGTIRQYLSLCKQARDSCLGLFNYKLEDIRQFNIQKLSKRYSAGGYTDQHAQNRADKPHEKSAHSPSNNLNDVQAKLLKDNPLEGIIKGFPGGMGKSGRVLKALAGLAMLEGINEALGVNEQSDEDEQSAIIGIALTLLVAQRNATIELNIGELEKLKGQALGVSFHNGVISLEMVDVKGLKNE